MSEQLDEMEAKLDDINHKLDDLCVCHGTDRWSMVKLGSDAPSTALGAGRWERWRDRKQNERGFIRSFATQLRARRNDLKLSHLQVSTIIFKMQFDSGFRDQVMGDVETAFVSAPRDVQLMSCPWCSPNDTVQFGDIDWENFNWEGARDFWVAFLKTLAEILILFI